MEEIAVEVKEGHALEVPEFFFARPPLGAVVQGIEKKLGKAKGGKPIRIGTSLRRELWQTFDVADGLASSTVNSMFQDRKGYLWLLTDGSASRYDGETFMTFGKEEGLAGNAVWTVLEDRQGNLWFGTDGGVSRYDGKNFTAFTAKDGLSARREINVATHTGSHSDQERSVDTLNSSRGLMGYGVKLILQDLKGHLWFGTGGGVSRYDGERFISFTTRDGLGDDRGKALFEDRQGNLWIGTDRGVSRYDGEQLVTFTEKEGLANNQVNAIGEDREGHLWFGTDGGASRWDGARFTNFTTADGLADNLVGAILEDGHGNLWFGTGAWRDGEEQRWSDRGGVSRFDGKRFT